MTTDRYLDRQLASWFEESATSLVPVGLLDRSLSRVDATAQRPSWLIRERWPWPASARRQGPFGRLALMLALLTVVAIAGVGAGMIIRQLPVVEPSIVPSSVAPSAPPSVTASPDLVAFIRTVEVGEPDVNGHRATRDELWVVAPDGTGAHPLIPGFGRHQSAPVWAPDGYRLIFSDRPAATGGGDRLYWTDVSGTAPTLVDPSCQEPCTIGDASFSADGQRIAFVREGDIVVMDLPSGRISSLSVSGGRPRWSPDGTRLLFERGVAGGRLNKDLVDVRILVADADGTDVRQLNPDHLPAAGAEWSPDGTSIAFHSEPILVDSTFVGSRNVYTVRPDGTDLRALTSDGVSSAPGWTADGGIRFTRDVGGTTEYWTMDADGRNASPINLPAILEDGDYLAWGPGL